MELLGSVPQESLALKLKLDFRFDELVCSWTILVPGDATLEDLHLMIRACGGWMNCHLHDFQYVSGGRLAKAEPAAQREDYESIQAYPSWMQRM